MPAVRSPLSAGMAFGTARIRTWRSCRPGRIGTAGRRRLGWLPGRHPSGSRRYMLHRGRWCRGKGWMASCRSGWISLVARRRDVIDGRTFGATTRFRQPFATSRLRMCRTGRATRPSGRRLGPCRIEPARLCNSLLVPTVRAWFQTLAGLKEAAGRKWLCAGSLVEDRARQRWRGAVAQVRKALTWTRSTRKNCHGLAWH